MKKLLLWKGYNVLAVSNGLEAIEAYTTKSEEIDLILMDIVMPEMTGFEALGVIKDFYPCVPILLMSGYAKTSFKDIPHTHFIRKPMFPQDLYRAIEEVLEESVSCYN